MNTLTAQPDVREAARMTKAFALFDQQSGLLLAAFENLKRDLAEANRQLNAKNVILSHKVDELQRVSGRLHCVLESLADGALVVNNDLVVELCNAASERLLDKPRDRIEGVPYAAIMNGLGDPAALEAAIRDGAVTCGQQREDGGNGRRKVCVLASVSPIRAMDGRTLGAVEVLRDVTELRALEHRVKHQERMAALGEMAASVAHEIRNPLGTIEGFARLLKRDLEGHPAHSRLAGKIVEGTTNLNYVITNLLTYVRPMSLQCEPFRLGTLLESAAEGLLAAARSHKVVLEIETPPDVAVTGDVRQLRQVLLNIGLNAIQACPPGGHVTIRAATAGGELRLSVSDTGCGISEQDLSRIFDPFFTNKQGGTGLGLSLSDKIVAAHGGRISVRSTPGKGSTFDLMLPCRGGKP